MPYIYSNFILMVVLEIQFSHNPFLVRKLRHREIKQLRSYEYYFKVSIECVELFLAAGSQTQARGLQRSPHFTKQNSAHILSNPSVQLLPAGKCGMYFVEDNASDTVESSVSGGLSLCLPKPRKTLKTA